MTKITNDALETVYLRVSKTKLGEGDECFGSILFRGKEFWFGTENVHETPMSEEELKRRMKVALDGMIGEFVTVREALFPTENAGEVSPDDAVNNAEGNNEETL